MLQALSIQNIVVIDRVNLTFEKGMCVLSGETGAGKSILLDALSLALGARADTSLIRQGEKRALVSATFDATQIPTLASFLDQLGLPQEPLLFIRRELNLEGPSRAFVNDQPVSLTTLKDLGNLLVDIHGQFDQLLEPEHHLDVLDHFCGNGSILRDLAQAYGVWQSQRQALETARATLKKAQEDRDFLVHAHGELCRINPLPQEAETLAQKRQHLMNFEKVHQALAEVQETLENPPLDSQIGSALRLLSRSQELDPDRLVPLTQALERTLAEYHEVQALLVQAQDADAAPGQLEIVDERLFTLKGLARKHDVPLETLHTLKDTIAGDLALLDNQADHLDGLESAVQKAQQIYGEKAQELNERRRRSAEKLDAHVMAALPDLKLDKASFQTTLTDLPEGRWGPRGTLSAEFTIATNPGTAPGSLRKVASGGERSRFMLALKTVLAQTHAIPTLVFDEADSGVGGATAAAIGRHLKALSHSRQVLVITHSPQVAARADHHWQIVKTFDDNTTKTSVVPIRGTARRDEIARMLSGEHITVEARAAADKLLEAS